MRSNILLALRVIPLCLFMGFGLPSLATAAGKATTSVKLPVEGTVLMNDGTTVSLFGMVRVVSQVLETTHGDLATNLRVSLAELKGTGDDVDATQWVGVGTAHPPDLCNPPDPCSPTMQFSLIPVGSRHPPDPVTPPTVSLNLVFDEVGNLLDDLSTAKIGRLVLTD